MLTFVDPLKGHEFLAFTLKSLTVFDFSMCTQNMVSTYYFGHNKTIKFKGSFSLGLDQLFVEHKISKRIFLHNLVKNYISLINKSDELLIAFEVFRSSPGLKQTDIFAKTGITGLCIPHLLNMTMLIALYESSQDPEGISEGHHNIILGHNISLKGYLFKLFKGLKILHNNNLFYDIEYDRNFFSTFYDFDYTNHSPELEYKTFLNLTNLLSEWRGLGDALEFSKCRQI